MKQAELAEWFGIKTQSFRNSKQQKLKQLSCYARYHFEGNEVFIDEIYTDIYFKSLEKVEYLLQDYMDKYFLYEEDKLNKYYIVTASCIADKMLEKEKFSCNYHTLVIYIGIILKEKYGKLAPNGSKAVRVGIYVDYKLIPLTEKELKIVKRTFRECKDIWEEEKEITYLEALKLAENNIGKKFKRASLITVPKNKGLLNY